MAIKTVPSASLGADAIAALKMEADFMKKLSHPRIVSCLGVLEYKQSYCIVMELCVNGSLASYLKENEASSVEWEKRNDFVIDIATGMNYLHKLGVIHRDLKLGNVVLDQYKRAKITDFGLSVMKSATQTSLKLDERGTPQYMAPESFGLVPVFSTKSDIYAFAIVLWEISHWTVSYHNVSVLEIRDSIREGARLPIVHVIPFEIRSLIEDCWVANPKERPAFIEVLDRLVNPRTDCNPKLPSTKFPKILNSVLKSVSNGAAEPNVTKRALFCGRKIPKKSLVLIVGLLILLFALLVVLISVLTVPQQNRAAAIQTTPIVATTTTKTSSSVSVATSITFSSFVTTTLSPVCSAPTETPVVSTLIQNNSFLGNVSGILVDSNDTIFAFSYTNKQIVRVSSLGKNGIYVGTDNATLTPVATIPSAIENIAYGRMCMHNNTIYVPAGGMIWKVSYVSVAYGNGVKGLPVDGPKLSAVFSTAYNCEFDNSGNMFVADKEYLRRINSTGYVTTVGDFRFQKAMGMVFDLQGYLNVADFISSQIYRINTTDFSYSVIAGNGRTPHANGQGIDSQIRPSAMTKDGYGNLFFTEEDWNSLMMINATGYVSRIAGDGISGMVSPTRFNFPIGLAFDSKETLYVCDSKNNAIRMATFPAGFLESCHESKKPIQQVPPISASSIVSVSSYVIDNNNLITPYGIAIDNADNLYTVTSSGKVIKINPQKEMTILAKFTPGSTTPGLCFSVTGLYITSGGYIYRLDLATNVINLFAGGSTKGYATNGDVLAATFTNARGCVYNENTGYLTIADESEIRRITSTGIVSSRPDFFGCRGCVGVDNHNGELLVTDFVTNTLYKVNYATDSFKNLTGSNGPPQTDGLGQNSSLWDPRGVLQRNTDIFLTEYLGNGVVCINSTGYVRLIAGGSFGYSNNGTGQFQNLAHLVFDSHGRLFVSESSGNSIRMIIWT